MINRDTHALYLPVRMKLLSFLHYTNMHIHNGFLEPFETFRSKKRQQELYNKGASKTTTSLHQLGLAVDVWFNREDGSWPSGKELDEWVHWSEFGELAKAHEFEWGGDFKNHDKVHLQATFGVDESVLKKIYSIKERKGVWLFLDDIIENRKNFELLTEKE